MSKSRGNVINPDDVVSEYGADSLRLYEMFMGPLKETKVWSTNGVEGVHRFLARAWRLVVGQGAGGADVSVTEGAPSEEQLRTLHACIQKVGRFRVGPKRRQGLGVSTLLHQIPGSLPQRSTSVPPAVCYSNLGRLCSVEDC